MIWTTLTMAMELAFPNGILSGRLSNDLSKSWLSSGGESRWPMSVQSFFVNAGQCVLKLVNIDDARPESWHFDIVEILKVALVDGRLAFVEMSCHVLPSPAWRICKETRDKQTQKIN